jgi:hypothetical protein
MFIYMKYPSIDDGEFYKKINMIYKKYTIPSKKRTLNEICFPEKYEVQLPQQFISQFINPETPYKDILVVHKIGSGKTCTAIRVGEEWKHLRNIMVLLPASLKSNFRNELRSLCAGNSYMKPAERDRIAKLHPSDPEYKDIIKTSDGRIDKYYTIYSYNKFAELSQNKKINLKNTVLIIDEIQNMISEEGTFYSELYKQVKKAPTNLRLVLLSATPMFDKPNEIALTMNLFNIPKEFPVGSEFDKMFIRSKTHTNGEITYHAHNLDIFKEMVKGYISYFRGAPPHVFPEMTIKHVKCTMNNFQYAAYKSVIKKEEKNRRKRKSQSVIDLPNNFFIGARVVSNVVFPNEKINKEGFESFTGKYITKDLEKYSCKFAKIIRKIETTTGKSFVYSGFKEYGGLKSFIRVLEEFGYKDYTKHGEGRKRFAIWSGDEDMNTKEEIRTIYNREENLDGSKLKLMLISPSGKEGLSLFGVRHAHILESYWNWSRMLQIIGRGSRFCSHKHLPKEKRNIKIYIYSAVHPNEPESVDQYIYKLTKEKNKLITEFETAMKEAAIDCTLFKNANVFKGEEDIKCDL